jgi:hypothetical protein
MASQRQHSKVAASWKRFLVDWQFAKSYTTPYDLDFPSGAFSNPILEALLPSLLFIRLVAILQEAIASLPLERTQIQEAPTEASLHELLENLEASGTAIDRPALDRIRRTRNRLAHETGLHVTWADLEEAIDAIESQLQAVALVGQRPELNVKGERSGAERSNRPGVLFEHHYAWWVEFDGEKVAEITWRTSIHDN